MCVSLTSCTVDIIILSNGLSDLLVSKQNKQHLKICKKHPTGRCDAINCENTAKWKYSSWYYTCLEDGQYHYFCNEHANNIVCPQHPRYGKRLCEVYGCGEIAQKYVGRIWSNCPVSYHFYCGYHFGLRNCPIHKTSFKRQYWRKKRQTAPNILLLMSKD